MRMGLAILGQGKRCESGTTNYFRILAWCIAKEWRYRNGRPTFFPRSFVLFSSFDFDSGWMGVGFSDLDLRGVIVVGLHAYALYYMAFGFAKAWHGFRTDSERREKRRWPPLILFSCST